MLFFASNKAPPKWKYKQDNIEYIKDHTLVLKCDAFAIPYAKYSWLKNGQLIISESRYSIKNSSLKIETLKLDDTANYSCSAENSLGRIENNFTITVLSEYSV